MAKRPRMRYPQPLNGVLGAALSDLGLAERLREADIWRVWNDVVGKAVSARAQPLRIINGVLTVAVSSAPWMQELRFMTAMIQEKLNTALGGQVINQIVLKSGKIGELDSPTAPEDAPQKKRLTPRQKALIEEQSAAIPDPETRQAFSELMKATFERPR